MSEPFLFTGLGNAAIDVICSVPESFLDTLGLPKSSCAFPSPAGLDAIESALLQQRIPLTLEPGGCAANTCAVIGALGGRAAFLGKTAADDYGARFCASLDAFGVAHPIAPLADEGAASTRIYTFITPDRDRTFANYPGAATSFHSHDLPPPVIASSRCLFVDGYALAQPNAAKTCLSALTIAKTHQVLRVFNPCALSVIEGWPDLVRACMDAAQGIICNLQEAQALSGADDPAQALDALASGRRFAAITLAEEGALARCGDDCCRLFNPLLPRGLVNTNGAGDSFAGGFMFGFTQNRPLEDCVALGLRCAVHVLGETGARPGGSLVDLL